MNVLDLFSGIGGFSLGLERAGMRTVAFCEIDPFCRKVLAKHWPDVPCYDDVRTLTAERLRADGIAADVICGGFPCQDISVAGKGAGIEGSRSGLWSEYARIIGEVRPRYVIVENVAALLGRGLDRVLGDLAALGFDAEWHCIPASAVGAPHRRDRLWIVANSEGGWQPEQPASDHRCEGRRQTSERSFSGTGNRSANGNFAKGTKRSVRATEQASAIVADTSWHVQSEQEASGAEWERIGTGGQSIIAHANGSRLSPSWPEPLGTYWRDAGGMFAASDWWLIEPDVGRVAHGVPARVDRLRSLGNAVVPQIPEIIGRAIMSCAMTSALHTRGE